MAVQRFRYSLAIVVLTWVSVAGAGLAQNSNLVVNPLFARDMPVPGWIGDHREAWVGAHPVYRAACQNAEVMAEIRFLNRVIAYDEYLLALATTSDPGNPTMDRLANVAKRSTDSFRRDITTVDALVAQLKLLPGCDGGAEKTAKVSTLRGQPMPETAGTTTRPPVPAAEPPTPAAPAPSAAKSSSDTGTEPAEASRIVIRFDNRVAALTPSGIRAFDGAVNALRAGKTVQLAIDGCEPGADFTNGSPCARRLATLKRMLADNGIRDAKKLLAEIR